MTFTRNFVLCASFFALLQVSFGAAAAALPEGGTMLVETGDFTASRDTSRLVVERPTSESAVAKENAELRAKVLEAAKDPWLAQLKTTLRRGVSKGERGLFILRARAVETSSETQQAQFRLIVADRDKPFPRVAAGQYSLDQTWREIALPFTFEKEFPAGRIDAMIDLGFGRQTVDIAEVRLMVFDASVPLASLPRTRPTYAGHEADAEWRKEALARIEKIRKGELTIVVTDAQGQPVRGAQVHAKLASHAFQFGTAVNIELLGKKTPDVERYREHIVSLFNAASPENALKWPNWAGDGKSADYRERTLRELAWLRDSGLAVRGHAMVWPGWRFLPGSIKELREKPDAIPEMVRAHIRDIAFETKDLVTEWDVLNEPVSNHDLMDLFGNDIMVDWFKDAAALLPGVPLYLNDWGNHDQRANPGTVKAFEDVAEFLIGKGAPLSGLGLQCHIGGVLNAPADLVATLDRYQTNFGLPVRITEFDVTVDDEEIQADYTRDFMIAMFSHPSVVGVQQWGFWEGRHWQPKAALYRKDWTEKPNGAAYRTLIKETWNTDESGATDAKGRWSAKGFYGRYDVTVTVDGKTHRATVSHAAGKADVLTVALPASF